ncbi:RICIN domain-containing protein [Streptomyces sp. NPDC004609]|uniref:RICIN domain-containing protein n=1 Tax=Streptomyces sp. NPDC004609 TaxID=3364704 RepID=UPI00368900D1
MNNSRIRRIAARTLVPALALAALGAVAPGVTAVAGPSAPSNAPQRAEGEQTYRNVHTGLCMDDSDGGGLRGYHCLDNKHQKWVPTRHADGTRQIVNVDTSRCLDDSREGLRTWPCNGQNYQRWTILPMPGGGIAFQNKATGACIVDPGEHKRLIALPCSAGAENQNWR